MELHLPRWNQLPGIALYMDQVVLVLGEMLSPFATAQEGPLVTPTMINNYVKMKLTPPPEKKKYTREHLALFVMICLLKKVFSMTELAGLKKCLLETHSLEEGYDLFCQEMEIRMQAMDGPDTAACPPVLAAAVRSVASKIQVEKLLDCAENSGNCG